MAEREQSKHGEYQLRDDSGRRRTALRLHPFVVNNYGSWGESAVTFLKNACKFSGKRGKFVVDQVCLAIARNIARRLRLSLGAVTWDRPGLPVTLFEQSVPQPAVGDGPGSSVPVDVSVSSTSVAQRTSFWQEQGGANGVPPPGNHRGPGALPAAGQPSPSVASFMGKGKSVLEAKGAKRAALEQAAGPIGSAGKGPDDSVLSPELATEIAVLEVATGQIGSVGKNSEVSVASPALAPGALAPGVRGVAGVGVQQGQHVFASESAERECEEVDGVVLAASPGFRVSPPERESERGGGDLDLARASFSHR